MQAVRDGDRRNEMDNYAIYNQNFLKPITFWGSITCFAAALWSFAPPLYLYFFYGAIPSFNEIMTGFLLIISFSGVLWIVEPPSYFPILGIPGTYMAFLAGNIANVRVPCSAVAQNAAGVEEGSRKGSLIATLAIGASVLVGIVILTIGVMFGTQMLESFPPIVHKALKYVLPAVFGGVFGQFALRNIRLGFIALVLSSSLILLKLPVWLIIPVSVFGSLYVGVWMKNRELNSQI